MAWFQCQIGSNAPSGLVLDTIVTAGVISDSSSLKTITFPSVNDYTYLYLNFYEQSTGNKTNYKSNRMLIVKVSDIGSGISSRVGRLWDSADLFFDLTKTSLTCTDYTNKYHPIYVDIFAGNDYLG